MKGVCLFFELHQPLRLRRYRFFDIGNDHYYYDDYTNETILRNVAENCYLPANRIILDLIKKHKDKFKVSFSLTGVLIEQLEAYAPEVLDSFRELATTGQVEFLAETYSHSLACMADKDEFTKQVARHSQKIEECFGIKPVSFRNTEMVYSDQIGSWVADMGFSALLTEGAKHILGWRSPDFLYCNNINPKLKVLLRNFQLSDDIAFRFGNWNWSEWPLTADKFTSWMKKRGKDAELINLFIDYETFGEHQKAESGIFNFLEALPAAIMKKTAYAFMTPSEVAEKFQPVSAIKVPNPISWADEERDLTAWLGNDLQDAAFNKLYSLNGRVNGCNDEGIRKDWDFLQVSDHFYYMCTKFFSDGAVHQYFNPYESPYDAFMNYMNVLSDFEIRLDSVSPENLEKQEVVNLRNKIEQIETELNKRETEVRSLRAKIKSMTASTTKSAPAARTSRTESKERVQKKKTTRTGKAVKTKKK
ncbi:MAG: polysaccharide deacetylase family protein [Bacteroidales bacterium]|nr:polysaccharide deacetylase family protein [Bacteroidales bacterium]